MVRAAVRRAFQAMLTYGQMPQNPIDDFGAENYRVLQPIPVDIRRIGDEDFLARFHEANIAIGGRDPQDAYQGLVAYILDTFEALNNEARLGPDAMAQLEVLRTYIVNA